jgi:hypothetical protein
VEYKSSEIRKEKVEKSDAIEIVKKKIKPVIKTS